MSSEHIVSQGECMATIARKYGFCCADSILEHPRNAGLKRRRTNPAVLYPGDRVFIPPKGTLQRSGSTGRQHQYVVPKPVVPLKVRIVYSDGRPIADKHYLLRVGGSTLRGCTDSEGILTQNVPIEATCAQVEIHMAPPHGIVLLFDLQIGHLDPIEEISGVQGRLINLGYACETSGRLDDATRKALRCFQTDNGLAVTGEINEETRQKLVDVHEGV